jgi:glutamyl-tRNA synthetase
MKPRVRFAPSPTGYLHIGGARTALFNWLYARHHGGTFVLRIEDTDQERSTPESLQAILDGLSWLGIDWDEGPGKDGPYPPYTQMEKLGRYTALAEQLVAEGKAYRDYTTEEQLAQQRRDFAAARGLPPDADLRKAGFKFKSPWRDTPEVLDRPYVVRFKMPSLEGSFGFDDLVLGRLEKPHDDLDDFVLLRSDGVPLYNFGCVVDDHDMHITHVGRGQEHINSTFPQLMLYRAFGWTPPVFAHIPLILGQDKEKLSKRRHPEADVMMHKKNGILPHALVNFIARLGWSHGNDETFTRQQLVELFDFAQVGKANGVWNPEKLVAINQHWIKAGAPAELAAALVPYLHEVGVPEAVADERLTRAVKAFSTRAKTLVEMAQAIKPYYLSGVTIDGAAAAKHLDPTGKDLLRKARALLDGMSGWTAAELDPIVDRLAADTGAKKGAIAQPIRVAVTGGTTSPGIGDTLELLGRAETLHRIDAVLGH